MLNIHPLFSSSSGNMFHIESNKTNILVDVGVTYKSITDGLKSIDKNISDISAILITHEHIDHIKGLPLICRKNNIPIYACGKTADYLKDYLDDKNISADIIKTHYGQPFKVKDFEITPFETSHDAVMPCGFNIKTSESSIGFATDLGYVTNEVFDYLLNSDYIIIESNYDSTMLDFGKYPFNLKRRIKSNLGHLSNDDTSDLICKLYNKGKNRFLLAHLSQNNNTSDIAIDTIKSKLQCNGINKDLLDICIATKDLSSEVINIC